MVTFRASRKNLPRFETEMWGVIPRQRHCFVFCFVFSTSLCLNDRYARKSLREQKRSSCRPGWSLVLGLSSPIMNTRRTEDLTPDEIIAIRDATLGQIAFARQYTLGLLEAVPESLWNVIPAGATSHIAWQVGHLAVSQYGLMLFRQRGRAEGDLELMPGWLRKKFSRGSQPSTVPEDIPSKSELLSILDAIHLASMNEAPKLSAQQLAEPIDMPYAVHPIKLGALMFCPLHESIHAGQIGLLRRLHGLEPVR